MTSPVTSLYKALVDQIICVCEENGLQERLKPLNLESDLSFIYFLFTDPIGKISKNFTEWQLDEWIDSMGHVQLGLLSFLYKQRITLGNIYKLGKASRFEILRIYQDLVINLRLRNTIAQGERLLIEEMSCENDFSNKTSELIFSFNRNFHEPKNISLLIDLLSIEYYRKKIIAAFVSGVSKFNIDLSDSDSQLSNFLSETFKEITREDIMSKIMASNLKGSIITSKVTEFWWKEYFRKVIQESIFLQSLKREINRVYSLNTDKRLVFKNNIKIVYPTRDFLEEYDQINHLNILEMECDNKRHPYYTFFDFQQRVLYLFFYILEQVSYCSLFYQEKKSDMITGLILPRFSSVFKCLKKTTANKLLENQESFDLHSIKDFFTKIKEPNNITQEDIFQFCRQIGIEITPEYETYINNFIQKRDNDSEPITAHDFSFLENSVITSIFKSPIHISQELWQDFKDDIKNVFLDIYNLRSKKSEEDITTFCNLFAKFPKYASLVKYFLLEILTKENFDAYTKNIVFFQKNPSLKTRLEKKAKEICTQYFDNLAKGDVKDDQAMMCLVNLGKLLDKVLMFISRFQAEVKTIQSGPSSQKKKVVIKK
ncbi:hypothetical protein DLEV_051 [Diachasmimorpha longicaudata entomopoxvirus]|uniref:Uncharacterized protein n=1 Tax=Diachasmimorpha longicaudata entomopoxvirus TaxID=109981 RepID=A0A7R5WCY6_9POXV|nr:hypothetical protein QKK69_gp051 [Diachasmimorpha longicaudata entomopoxvirus]AKS26342.1 hypothetical protein DLEV_051 [Diachasmimorpha longicaudata entomopoxvirus]